MEAERRRGSQVLELVGRSTSLALGSAGAWWRAGAQPRRLAREAIYFQAHRLGWNSLSLVAFAGLLIGGLIHLQALSQMSQFGLESYLGELFVVLVVRELGPLLTALLLLGRSGAAMTTELGLMGLSEEFEALQAFGVDARLMVVLPRLAGAVLALLCLTVAFDLAALAGGMAFAAARFHLPTAGYAAKVFEALRPLDIGLTAVKGVGFGLLLSAPACALGLRRHPDPQSVADATDRTVVAGFCALFVLDLLLAVAAYG